MRVGPNRNQNLGGAMWYENVAQFTNEATR